MNLIIIWISAYIIPGLMGYVASSLTRMNQWTRVKIIHLLLLTSTSISFYVMTTLGLSFPWTHRYYEIIIYLVSIGCAVKMIGKFGVFYGVSSLLQELTLLSIAFILSSGLHPIIVYLMVIPIFVLAHDLGHPDRYKMILVLSLWGAVSFALFLNSVDIFLIAAIHTISGSYMIKKSFIYR